MKLPRPSFAIPLFCSLVSSSPGQKICCCYNWDAWSTANNATCIKCLELQLIGCLQLSPACQSAAMRLTSHQLVTLPSDVDGLERTIRANCRPCVICGLISSFHFIVASTSFPALCSSTGECHYNDQPSPTDSTSVGPDYSSDDGSTGGIVFEASRNDVQIAEVKMTSVSSS
eukprot:387894-Amphidinium_carterae.1